MVITLFGRIPSKKNSKIILCRRNRPLLISNPKYQEWETEQLWVLKDNQIRKHFPRKINSMELKFFFPDLRKTDLSNKTESVMDLLVKSELIEDDNYTIVPILNLIYGGVDKVKPRVEITFY